MAKKKIDPAVRAFLAQAGRKGGQSTTDAKTAASRANGKKGGRPRKAKPARQK